jgi:hypothetical protein
LFKAVFGKFAFIFVLIEILRQLKPSKELRPALNFKLELETEIRRQGDEVI